MLEILKNVSLSTALRLESQLQLDRMSMESDHSECQTIYAHANIQTE